MTFRIRRSFRTSAAFRNRRSLISFVSADCVAVERLYLCRTSVDESGKDILPSVFVQTLKKNLKKDGIAIHSIPKKTSPDQKYSPFIYEIVLVAKMAGTFFITAAFTKRRRASIRRKPRQIRADLSVSATPFRR